MISSNYLVYSIGIYLIVVVEYALAFTYLLYSAISLILICAVCFSTVTCFSLLVLIYILSNIM